MTVETENAVVWPEKPTCHGDSPTYSRHGVTWREPRKRDDSPYEETFRTCSYCGSIHPQDLVNALAAGATLGGADWKYGWPHKFYIDGIPNPKVGQPHVDYSYCGNPSERMLAEGGWEQYQDGFDSRTGEPKMSWRQPQRPRPCPPTLHAKWYNEHLLDLSPEAFAVLTPLIQARARIRFVIEEGRLKYQAPYRGYQA